MAAACLNTPDTSYYYDTDYRDIIVPLPCEFTLESGERLSVPALRVRLFGDEARPLIVAMGGISAGRDVADTDAGEGWWRALVCAGGAVDLNRFCVLGFDFLPNREETARTITTIDQARGLAIALDYLDIANVHALVGASYGAMIALAFAARYPARASKLCVISAADRAHPAATAVRGVQRRIMNFAAACGRPQEGVALARQLAMTTYRTPEEFAQRFGGAAAEAAGDPYDVCDYLIARGDAFGMDYGRYLTLSDSLDRHHIDAAAICAQTFLLAATSDRLVPLSDMRRLACAIPGAPHLHEIQSLFGHDAFLKETAAIGPKIKTFIEEI